ncbi:MAG: YigZ family protein [Bacteroidetes bacterium]|nr:YigZ family protein [Bacteroidota bacterium]
MSQTSSPEAETEHPSDDSFLTIAGREETEIKILASRFLSYALPCPSAEDFTDFLDVLRKQHYNATHHCFAWRIGYDGTEFRYSDDGEPSGTAGKRILGSIDRRELTDVGIVVVRYFGGTKLGVGGLARAYTDAADAVLERCAIERRYHTDALTLTFPYDVTSQVHHVIDMHGVEVLDREYLDQSRYTVRVRRSLTGRFSEDFAAYTERRGRIQGI